MSFPSLVRLLPGFLASLLVCSAALAQIHEEKATPRLDEGVIAHFEKDANLNVQTAAGQKLGTSDFSVVCSLVWKGGPPLFDGFAPLTGSWDGSSGWKLMLSSDATLGFSVQSGSAGALHSINSPPLDLRLDQENLVVISAHRDARQPGCGIWVNGVEVASGILPPVDLGEGIPKELSSALQTTSLTLYNRALTRPEILELSLRGSGTASDKPKPKHPTPPTDGPRFIPQPDETIALIGGTEAVALAESGELEALLLMAFPQTKFHFRCLAWEGDTVFRQDRPMNFGSLEQQLRRMNAGAVFVMFGRQECLDAAQGAGLAKSRPESKDGTEPVPLLEFKTAFDKLLDTVAKVTPNIVVIGPMPFEKKEPPMPDLSGTNKELMEYSTVIGQVAQEKALVCSHVLVHAFEMMVDGWEPKGMTEDGVALTNKGRVMSAFWSGWGLHLNVWPEGGKELMAAPAGFYQEPIKSLLPALRTKNRLWHDYWRPSNWAFLHGDRTNQPSSRDPVNPQIRFFPSEQEKYLPLIKAQEEKIHQLVQEAQKKLP